MKVSYIQWRDGLAFFRRRIPVDLQGFYPGKKGFIFYSLKTSDPKEAMKRAHAEAQRLDVEWISLRSGTGTTGAVRAAARAILRKHGLNPGQWKDWEGIVGPADDFEEELFQLSSGVENLDAIPDLEGPHRIVRDNLPPEYALAADLFYANPDELPKLLVPLLSEVRDKHIEFKPRLASDEQFHRALNRFMTVNGDLPIDRYRRVHGNAFVKDMVETGLKSATVKRYLAQVRPVFDTAIIELEIVMSNPLSKMKIPIDQGVDQASRSPFTVPQIRAIQHECRERDDERRWAILVLSDTGCRLSEVLGLLRSEVIVDDAVPHLIIQPNRLRGLKAIASRRRVPLVGEAFHGVTRALDGNDRDYLFPGLISADRLNSASVSAALNKWLRDNGLRNEDQPLHSFRHSLRDRLRNAGVPTDVQDRIGGWQSKGVGEGYGVGHNLEVLRQYMVKALVDSHQ